MGETGATSNKQATTISNVGNDGSRMQVDEEEKGQGPSATGADQFLSPLQQLKALFNKLDMESKTTQMDPHQSCTPQCSARRLEHPGSSFGRFWQRTRSE
jgi:hypothetical protein